MLEELEEGRKRGRWGEVLLAVRKYLMFVNC
jgi:hypothetical protein